MSSVASSESPYGTLSRLSDPILRFLSHANTTELVINEPGSAFVETDGEWREVVDEVFSKDAISRFVTAVDSFAKGNLQAGESALLSTTLPTGQRVQVVGAPAVQHFALAIRKPGAVKLTLHDYERAGAFAGLKTQALGQGDGDQRLLQLLQTGEIKEFLRECVVRRKTLVVSGGTSTGKTTFFNALTQSIPLDERLISIEDSREIMLDHRNKLHLLTQRGSQKNTFLQLLEACLRLRPDRILAAEIRGEEAFTFLRAVNTGHPGSITTIHANSTRAARSQIAMMVSQARLGLPPETIKDFVAQSIDVFVQLSRLASGERVVSEIEFRDQVFSR